VNSIHANQTSSLRPMSQQTKPPLWIMDSNGRMIYTQSGDHPWEPTLTPGAYLAKQRGCTCSRLDNKWGEGRIVLVPRPAKQITNLGPYATDQVFDLEYSIQPGCPLHDLTDHNQDRRQSEANSDSRPVAEQSSSDH